MKKGTKICILFLALTLLLVCFCSCQKKSAQFDITSHKNNLKKHGYTVVEIAPSQIAQSDVNDILTTTFGCTTDDISGIVSASLDGDFILYFTFKNASAAKSAYENAASTFQPMKDVWEFGYKGNVLYYGTKAAYKAATGQASNDGDVADTPLDKQLKKVYPAYKKADTATQFPPVTTEYGSTNAIYPSTDGTIIISCSGNGGYGGSVTVLVAVGTDKLIKGVAVTDDNNETMINRFPDSVLSGWYVGKNIADVPTTQRISGATVTSNAINNAIRVARRFCEITGVIEDEPGNTFIEAVEFAIECDDIFRSYTFEEFPVLNCKIGNVTLKDMLSDESSELNYVYCGNGARGWTTIYVYNTGDDMKIAVITPNLASMRSTQPNDPILQKIRSVRLAMFSYTTTQGYTTYAYAAITEVEGRNEYTVAGLKVSGMPETYILQVVITEENGKGKVQYIYIDYDGWVPGDPSADAANKLATSLVGATSDTVGDIYRNEAISGASQSASKIAAAVQAALADFDARL